MTEPKKPQDHKTKVAEPETLDGIGPLVFEWDGETYELSAEEMAPHVEPGFFRKNRNLSESGQAWALIELLERGDILDVIDGSWGAMEAFAEVFTPFLQRVLVVVMATR